MKEGEAHSTRKVPLLQVPKEGDRPTGPRPPPIQASALHASWGLSAHPAGQLPSYINPKWVHLNKSQSPRMLISDLESQNHS